MAVVIGTAGRLTRPKKGAQPRRGKSVECGPFIGLRDSLDPSISSDPKRAFVMENMYPLELDKESTFVGRPGFAVAGAQGGAANKRTGQCVGQFTTNAGTEYTFRIIGGQGIQTYNWSTDTWSTVVSVANLTTASVTLSETAHIGFVVFTNLVIFSDGVNVPFSWTGASGAGGVVSLTASPVLYGQPTTYYSKLAGIKNAERNVWVYSEENDSTIGYETAPYANTWQLTTTSRDAFTAIIGTNERLYYLRDYSSGAVSGAVTPEFQSDGTKEGLDETIGSLSPWAVVYRDHRVFFLDARARPHVIDSGRVIPCWEDIHETLGSIDLTKLSNAIACYDATTQLVLFGVTEIGQTNPSCIFVFNPVLTTPVAVWRGFTFQAMAVVKNGSGVPTLMHLSDDGYAYTHGLPDGTTWSDALVAGTNPIRHTVEGPHMAVSSRYEKKFVRADVILRADSNATSLYMSYNTPYGSSTPQSASVSGSGARYGTAIYGTDTYAYATVERHVPFGLNGQGRWIRPRLQHEVAGERFGVATISVEQIGAGDSAVAD